MIYGLILQMDLVEAFILTHSIGIVLPLSMEMPIPGI